MLSVSNSISFQSHSFEKFADLEAVYREAYQGSDQSWFIPTAETLQAYNSVIPVSGNINQPLDEIYRYIDRGLTSKLTRNGNSFFCHTASDITYKVSVTNPGKPNAHIKLVKEVPQENGQGLRYVYDGRAKVANNHFKELEKRFTEEVQQKHTAYN